MRIRHLIPIGLIAAALATTATAQQYGYNGQYDQRDMRRRDELVRKVEADRRAVEHEREELRRSNRYNAGHESRELRRAEDRLDRDSAKLRAFDERLGGRRR